jgi:hypothetical protein
MEKATIIGIDLAKRVFQVHGATQDGRPVFRRKVSRAQFLGFLASRPSWRWKPARRRMVGDGRSAVSGTRCGSFRRFT